MKIFGQTRRPQTGGKLQHALFRHAQVGGIFRRAAGVEPIEIYRSMMRHKLRGQVVKAFVVTDRKGDQPFIKEIQDLVRSRLSQHEYPRVIEFVAELPKTPAGKVNRKILRTIEKGREKENA